MYCNVILGPELEMIEAGRVFGLCFWVDMGPVYSYYIFQLSFIVKKKSFKFYET